MNIRLTSLRKKVFRTYLFLVVVFGVTGSILVVVSTFIATGITPRAIHMNYDSIEAARLMQEAWQTLHHPEERPVVPINDAIKQFENSLKFAKSNITEPEEPEVVNLIEDLWTLYRDAPANKPLVPKMNEAISRLAIINETAMFKFIGEGSRLRTQVLVIVVMFFLACLFVTVYLADKFATNISEPLKRTAEVLRSHPLPGERLKLPTPDSLELRILVKEISELWQRISKTEQLNLETLVAKKAQLETLLSSVDDNVLMLDRQGQVAFINDNFLKLIEIPYSEAINGYWEDLSTVSENYLKLRSFLSDIDNPESTLELALGSTQKFFESRVRIVKDPDQRQIGTLYLLHDVTDDRYSKKLQAEFVGVLSHELKTPLQSLGIAVELLLERKENFHDQEKMLIETIAEDVERIRNVANDFIQISRLPSIQLISLNLKRTNLTESIKQWVKPFYIVATEKKVSIKVDIEKGIRLWASIDQIKFPWTISNLLSNAIRVNPRNSEIHVTLTYENGNAMISVRDQGPGVPKGFEELMFEPFKKGSSGSSEGIMGLGLTIASEIASAHGGKIEYKESLPQGADFRIMIPAEKEVVHET